MLQPSQFPVFVWERLSWFGEWIDGTTGDNAVAGHATTAGAITFTVVGAIATAVFLNRKKLAPVGAWLKRHPWVTTILGLIALPFGLFAVAIILMSLTKYLTFASAMATTVGVLVALDNNRRSHDREEQRFIRQAKAARAALSLDLSTLCDHCSKLIEEIDKIPPLPSAVATKFFSSGIKFPPAPSSITATIKEVMLSTKNEAISDRCALVLGHLQLVHAFLDTMFWPDMFMSQSDVETRKLRVAILYTIVSSLFDYARYGKEDLAEIDWNTVLTSAGHLGLDTSTEFNDYVERAKVNHPKGPLAIWDF